MTSLALAWLLALAPNAAQPESPPQPPAAPPAATPEIPVEPKLPPVTKSPPPAPPVTLPSGVIIQDTAPAPSADAATVKQGDIIIVSYTGTLKGTGAPFDASVPGSPLVLPLTRAIKGWQEGVPGMKIGAKRAITIPASLAFGDKGRPPRIPPNADLVFDIEVINALQVIDLKAGEGEMVAKGASLTANFRAALKADGVGGGGGGVEGVEVDSSNGTPITFALDGVILGWKYGLLGMKVGGTRKLIIPWQLAYGEAGNPPQIPAKADLVVEIELTAVVNSKPDAIAAVPEMSGDNKKPAPAETVPPAEPK